jgi:tyrosine phenol-lyase
MRYVFAMSRELDLIRFKTEHLPRPYVNAFVRPHHLFTTKERHRAAVKAGWNVFQFPSEMLQGGDLLSDSGTTTLALEQLSSLILGDEAYGSNWGYFQLLAMMEKTFGISNKSCGVYLFHQCRAAEHALYSHLTDVKVVPSNSFFDTTRANAEANGIKAIDLPDTSEHLFQGNVDLSQLEHVLKKHKKVIPFVLMTVTNNTGGGQPVSMKNLKEARALTKKYGVSLFLDACRFAENAWFIKRHENAYKKKAISEIVHAMFSLCDGFTISFKKDGLANMGGALVIRKDARLLNRYPHLLDTLYDHQILTEGHPTYGGISGRDIMTIVEGLKVVTTESYLNGRINLVRDFGQYMKQLGIPILEPVGGHAVYIDVDEFFADTNMRREDFGGISLTALLLLKGVRLCELGAFAFGTYNPKTKKETFPKRNYVRAAVPRNKYERDDLYYVADCIKALYDRRHELPKAIPTYGRDKTLRHFKARFELQY